jgi:hypothetical protein
MNFVYLRSSRLHVFKLEPWFMHWQQGGERKVEKSCISSLEPIPRVKGERVHFFCIFGFWGVWSAVWNRPDRFWEPVWPVLVEPVWPVLGTGLTGLCQVWHLFRGSLHMCRWSSCMLWWFVLFAWAWFCLGCVESLPLPKGPETSSSDPVLCLSRLSIACWSFFLFVSFHFPFLWFPNMCVVNALIKGEIEDHVWFEDRWMVAS